MNIVKFFFRAVLFVSSILFVNVSFAQSLNTCENIGFEQGNFEGWTGRNGNDGELTEEGIFVGRQTIFASSQGPDPIISNISMVAPGSEYSVRLGNSNDGFQTEQLSTSFLVTEDNSLFSYQFAIILEEPGHSPEKQPKFEVEAFDEMGNLLPCGYYKVVAASNIEGFESQGNIIYRDWSTVGIDLTDYIGQVVTINFTTTDCAEGGHFGYAYIDAECLVSELYVSCASDPFCSEDAVYCEGSSLTLLAPDGFADYNWSNGVVGRELFLENPIPGTSYTVIFNNDTSISIDTCYVTLSVTIPEPSNLPEPQIEGDFLICPGESTLIIVDQDYVAYQWSNGSNEATADLQKGSHSLTVTNDAGCKGEIHFVINEVELAIIEAEIDSVSCYGLSDGAILATTISDYLPVSYSWGTDSLSALAAGSYPLTVTDGEGCASTALFVVNEPQQLLANQFEFDSVSCFGGNDGSLSSIPLGGTPPYSYFWSTGSIDGNMVSDLASSEYSVTVTDANNCMETGTFFIPEPPVLVGQLIQDSVSCYNGNDGSIQLFVGGGTPGYDIVWNIPGNDQETLVEGLPSGIYSVTIVDENSCTIIESIEVFEPAPLFLNMEADSTTCPGGDDGLARVSVNGGTPGYSYAWNAPTAYNQAVAENLYSGSYLVTVTDHNNCQAEATIFVPQPPDIVLEMQQDSVSCFEGRDGKARVFAAGGSPGYSYLWILPTNENGFEATDLEAGHYEVEVRDQYGCLTTNSIDVLQPAPIGIETIEQAFPDCDEMKPGFALVEVSGGTMPYYYFWETAQFSDTVSSLDPGIYDITVVDNKGCEKEASAEIPGFEVEIEADGLQIDQGRSYLCLNDSIFLSLPSTLPLREIRWSCNSPLSCYDCPLTSSLPVNTETYRVDVLDENGCPASDQIEITVNKRCGTYIPNVFSPNGDGINDLFYVYESRGGVAIEEFYVFNRWGNLVFEIGNCYIGDPNYGWDGMFNGNPLNIGVYVYSISIRFSDDQVIVFKGDVTLLR